jgi:RNA polymerase sigma-70 factor (ECF subfamily)
MDLDVSLRGVVVCRFLLDWSVKQTAEALDIRPGTVKSRTARALESLENKLYHYKNEG